MCVYVCVLVTDLDPWFGVRSAGWEQDVEMTGVAGGKPSDVAVSWQTDLLHPPPSGGPDTYSIRPNAASLAQLFIA